MLMDILSRCPWHSTRAISRCEAYNAETNLPQRDCGRRRGSRSPAVGASGAPENPAGPKWRDQRAGDQPMPHPVVHFEIGWGRAFCGL